jgi:hypothetical protein
LLKFKFRVEYQSEGGPASALVPGQRSKDKMTTSKDLFQIVVVSNIAFSFEAVAAVATVSSRSAMRTSPLPISRLSRELSAARWGRIGDLLVFASE